MNFVDILGLTIFELGAVLIIFMILTVIGIYISKAIRNSDSRFVNPQEFLPEDEIFTLKQVFYLIMMGSCFIIVLYSLTFLTGDVTYLCVFDVALSLGIAIMFDKSSLKNKILILLLIPYGSLSFLIFGLSFVSLLDFLHVPVFIYFIKYYYDQFRVYTDSNGLGIAVILLFTIIFISFLITQVVEGVNPLDSLVMVSNAFTSNGYAVLGHSIPGKINSLFLVWGGYIISGVGTATLTAAILIRRFNKRLEKLQKLIDEVDLNDE